MGANGSGLYPRLGVARGCGDHVLQLCNSGAGVHRYASYSWLSSCGPAICLLVVVDHLIVSSGRFSIAPIHARSIHVERMSSRVISAGMAARGGAFSRVCPPLPRATSWPAPMGMLQA